MAMERERLLRLFERLRSNGLELDVEILQKGESAGVSADNPVAQAMAKSIKEITGSPAASEMFPGLLEIRFYTQQGVPAFAYRPGSLSATHGLSEFVQIGKIHTCAAIYALSAARLLASS